MPIFPGYYDDTRTVPYATFYFSKLHLWQIHPIIREYFPIFFPFFILPVHETAVAALQNLPNPSDIPANRSIPDLRA